MPDARIDLFYSRPSCESCASVRATLVAAKARVGEERSTAKLPLSLAEVRTLLAAVSEVWIARGRAVDRRRATEVSPEALLGPTGKFRAPMVRRGQVLLVGLHRESLAELLRR